MQNSMQKPKSGRPGTDRLFIFLRIGFGFIFVFSGSIKIANSADFFKALSNFETIPEPLIPSIAILIPVIEILIGGAIAVGLRTALMSQLAVVMLVLFTAIVTAKLSEGAEISCACFGPLSSDKMSATTVGRNIVLLFWGILVFAFEASRLANQQAAKNSQIQDKGEKPAALARTLPTSAYPSLWKNLQRLIGFVIIFFLTIEIVLLSQQNRELKSRLALLVGDDKSSVKSGDIVPPFKATNLEGEVTEIAYDGVAKKTLLLIFSTSCGACERNLPNWTEIASKLKEGAHRVVGISVNPLDKTKHYALKNGITYSIFVAIDTSFSRPYKVFSVPQTLLIDAKGRVAQVWMGVLDSLQVKEILGKLCSHCE